MPDPFRSTYRELTDAEKAKVAEIKRLATALYGTLEARFTGPVPDARMMEYARTKLEECVFWSVKAITG